MNFTGKVLGLAAVAAMAIGFAGNASAETTSATLADGPGISCGVLAGGGSVDFGTYTWNGTAYTAPVTQPSFNVVVTQTVNPEDLCNVTVLGTDLTSAVVNVIPVGAVDFDATPDGQTLTLSTSAQALFNAVADGTYPVDVDLDTVDLDSLPTGTYTGTLTFAGTVAP